MKVEVNIENLTTMSVPWQNKTQKTVFLKNK